MKALKQTILLGIFFVLLVTTYNSFSFIVTYIYEHRKDGFKQMGPVLLGVNYFTFLVTNSFVPSIRWTLTMQMKVASLCYTLNYVAQAFQFPGGWGVAFSVIGAVAGGYGAAMLWVCYGAYMKTICKINHQEHIQGKYFSILNGIAFSSFLFGSLITTFCLGLFSDQIYFIILSGIGFIAFLFCIFFIKEVQHKKDIPYSHSWVTQLKRSLRYYRKMTAIVPTLIFDGLLLAFISTSSTNLMPQNSQKVEIGIFLILLSCGCIVGGILSGYLSDIFSMKNVGKLAIVFILVVSVLTALLSPEKMKINAFILAFLLGIARQFIEGWLYVACSRNYNGRLQSYANMKQLHSLSFCLYQVMVIITKLKINILYIMLANILMSPICFYGVGFLPQGHDSKQANIQEKDKGNNQCENETGDVTISLESSSDQGN